MSTRSRRSRSDRMRLSKQEVEQEVELPLTCCVVEHDTMRPDACCQQKKKKKRGCETERARFHICQPDRKQIRQDCTPRATSPSLTTSVLCFHRVGGKMSGSHTQLDRCGQTAFGESPLWSSGGLGSASPPTASTDSLTADTSEDRFLFQTRSCPSLSA